MNAADPANTEKERKKKKKKKRQGELPGTNKRASTQPSQIGCCDRLCVDLVNLIAFDSRLRMICCNLVGSINRLAGMDGSTNQVR